MHGSFEVDASGSVREVGPARVLLSTSSTYPESTESAFEAAATLGYDGVELMVSIDPVSQSLEQVRRLSREYDVPVAAIHAPCLLVTQRVWGSDPWVKLVRAQRAAEELGARTVVVHPPFAWQREYARAFVAGIEAMHEDTDVVFAVENMYPWRARGREVQAYQPGWDPVSRDYRHVTLDLSHAATARSDGLEMAHGLGDRLAHVHLADGSGSAKDEHLVPGRGNQPCAELLDLLRSRSFAGSVVLEVNTRRAPDRQARRDDLAQSLAFARAGLAGRLDPDAAHQLTAAPDPDTDPDSDLAGPAGAGLPGDPDEAATSDAAQWRAHPDDTPL